LPVLQTYGLTEACSQVTTERLAEADGTTAGRALPGLEVQIIDGEGHVVTPGIIGEIRVKGQTVTPAAGSWLSTKDLGSLDDRGRLTVHARRVDLIVSGGENVYPAEIEAVLRESGLVDDVAVVPVASARLDDAHPPGEVVMTLVTHS
jgi:O-succinylbenzoic acid--CoA ligase